MDNTGLPIEQQTMIASPHASRPWNVTILAFGVLIITIFNLTRLILSIANWDFLVSWPGVPALYMVMTGLIWTLVCSILLWGLWRAKNWAPRLMKAVLLTYVLYYWLDHVFLMDHPNSGAAGAWHAFLPVNWRFAAVITVVCMVYTVRTLSKPKVKVYFGLAESKTGNDLTDSGDNG
jgi:hypothetical protein